MTLLTVEELRAHITSPLSDAALQLLLDASEGAITALYGAVGDTVEVSDGGQSYIFLRRPAASVTGIVETDGITDTTLNADDYRVRSDAVSVLRLATGTNPRSWWGGPVAVTYEPLDDVNQRKVLQISLIRLDLNFVPGNSTTEQIGSWLESSNASGSFDYGNERTKILESLRYIAPGFA